MEEKVFEVLLSGDENRILGVEVFYCVLRIRKSFLGFYFIVVGGRYLFGVFVSSCGRAVFNWGCSVMRC